MADRDTILAEAINRVTANLGQLSALRLRPGTNDDIDDVRTMADDATLKFAAIPALEHVCGHDRLSRDSVMKWIESGPLCIAELDGRPAGFIAAHTMDTALYIAEISVRRDAQGKGVGSALMDVVFEFVREQRRRGAEEATYISLTTYVEGIPWNGPWYEKRGFEEVDGATLGPQHLHKLKIDRTERDLERPGYRRGCMVWRDR